MASQNILELNDGNFDQEILTADRVALVDFWAEWCRPCKMLAPTIEELADEYAGRIKVGKIDTDSSRQTALKYGIQAIPTVILFKDGEPARKFVGLQSKKDFKAAIDALL